MRTQSIISILAAILIISSCTSPNKKNKLIIFHAGSLSVPFKEIATAFEQKYPEVKVELEAAGSRACARKISDLNKPCDIMASADYKVIDNLLIPKFAQWNIKFASNEMALVYSEKSLRNKEINENNWIDILLDPTINYGRSEPDSDPCGYRTILVAKLAEKYYLRKGISDSILHKDNEHIRPKEVDLLALLEAQVIDYVFIYKSVAKQHGLKYVTLPDSINLKDPKLVDYYKLVTVKVSGKKPGEFIIHNGEPMVYGLTHLKKSPNPEYAQKFLEFFFIDSIGIKIMAKNGQPSVLPTSTESFHNLPEFIKPYARK